MKVLVIGGTGTLAKSLIPLLLRDDRIQRIRILSRGEHAQSELREKYRGERMDFFIGDVRDRERILMASEGCDQVYHFAANKEVDTAEYNPFEAVLTNIIGTQNVIRAVRKNEIKKAIFTSSDKACEPINLYGATKLVAEKMFIQSNIGYHKSRYACVRYGNVLASQGSVVERWRQGVRSITDPTMTRFFWSPDQAARFVMDAMFHMEGGEIFIPKMKATTIQALFQVVVKGGLAQVTGERGGEKQHECLISRHEWDLVTDCGWCWIKWPSMKLFPVKRKGTPVESSSLGYTSDLAVHMDDLQLEELCK